MPESSVEKIIEKVESISESAVSESKELVSSQLKTFEESLPEKVELLVSEKTKEIQDSNASLVEENQNQKEKLSSFEAELKEMKSASVHLNKPKTIAQDVTKRLIEGIQEVVKTKNHTKEIQVFEDHYQLSEMNLQEKNLKVSEAYFNTQSNSYNLGGPTNFMPITALPRVSNKIREIAKVTTSGSASVQFHKNSSDYAVVYGDQQSNNDRSAGLKEQSWIKPWVKMTSRFSISEDVLGDINGLQANMISDMLSSFARVEAMGMFYNDDSVSYPEPSEIVEANYPLDITDGATLSDNTTRIPQGANTLGIQQSLGRSFGFESLTQHQNVSATWSDGGNVTAGTWGTASNRGVERCREYTITDENLNVADNHVVLEDLFNVIYALPMQYRANAKFLMSPELLSRFRTMNNTLVESSTRPTNYLFENPPLVMDTFYKGAIFTSLCGFPVVENPYMASDRAGSDGSQGNTNGRDQVPLIFGDFDAYQIVDRADLSLRLYYETVPDKLTFFAKKRSAASLCDPNALVKMITKKRADLSMQQLVT